jgi:hypothetical protein
MTFVVEYSTLPPGGGERTCVIIFFLGGKDWLILLVLKEIPLT